MQSDSPFKRLRMLVGVSVAEFASESNISRQSVLNLEAGMYVKVPSSAHVALSRMVLDHGVDARRVLAEEYGVREVGGLNEAMDSWKRAKRRQTDMSGWPRMSLNQIVRRFDTPGTFCRKLCVPTAALYNVTTRHTTPPKVLQEALHDAGYPFEDWTVE